MGLLLASTAVVAVCAEFLVSSIDEMVKSSGVSQAFIGLIVLPIVGNAAEVSTPQSKPFRYPCPLFPRYNDSFPGALNLSSDNSVNFSTLLP